VHPYFPFPFSEPAFSEPDPVSANKYRNGNRNGGFPSVSVHFQPYPKHAHDTAEAGWDIADAG
jgi:hypothetical protein